MGNPIQRRGDWWQQQPDGSWLKWDEAAARWDPQQFPPPPPEDSEKILQAWGASPATAAAPPGIAPTGAIAAGEAPTGAAGSADPLAPTPGYKYVRGDDGTWWARSETTGELHWHHASSGQWRRYIDPNAPAARASTRFPAEAYAGFWKRVAASVIDGILLGGVTIAFLWPWFNALENGDSTPEEAGSMIVLIQVGSVVASWLYEALMESSSKQGTLGKMALGIRVTDMDGRRIGFAKATGRHFAKYVSQVILFIGFLMVVWTDQKQGLHDQLAGTLVLKGKPPGPDPNTP